MEVTVPVVHFQAKLHLAQHHASVHTSITKCPVVAAPILWYKGFKELVPEAQEGYGST